MHSWSAVGLYLIHREFLEDIQDEEPVIGRCVGWGQRLAVEIRSNISINGVAKCSDSVIQLFDLREVTGQSGMTPPVPPAIDVDLMILRYGIEDLPMCSYPGITFTFCNLRCCRWSEPTVVRMAEGNVVVGL